VQNRSIIRRAAVCGSFMTCSTVFTGVAGTPPLEQLQQRLAIVRGNRVADDLLEVLAMSYAPRFVAKRSSRSAARSSAATSRCQKRSLAPAMKTHCPSRQRKLR
jgi:hypothetical protein